jgi:hypothetical protein
MHMLIFPPRGRGRWDRLRAGAGQTPQVDPVLGLQHRLQLRAKAGWLDQHRRQDRAFAKKSLFPTDTR